MLALCLGAQSPCPNMHQEERSFPTVWPGREKVQGVRPRGAPSLPCYLLPWMGTFAGCLVAGNGACFSPGREKPGAEAGSLALDCNARTSFPKWTAGVSPVTAAVAM